ncbi:cartilage matrix protein-like [Octopus sinensis]|uniref:Cartilage matrix protein-like n=1 Tax=Octopus sinensis TaxID=2607531 RepID=A0A7E6F4M5_9MOLL|nr:cartilage matrix protein-like [Octopus sinensis]
MTMRFATVYFAVLATSVVIAHRIGAESNLKSFVSPYEEILCQDPADIVFVLDSSRSVTQTDFKKELDFVSSFVKDMDISSNKIQIGVVTFSDNVKTEFELNKFSQKQDIQNAVSNIAHRGGSTNTWLALKHIRTESFITDHGGRVGIPKIVILVTAGGSNGKSKTLNEAKLLHNDPLRVFTVAVGNKVDDDELRAIASKPENAFKVSDFNSLATIEDKVMQNFCRKGEIFCYTPADIVFVLDSSRSVTQTDFKKELDFVSSFVKDMDISSDKVQIGVVTFSDNVKTEFELNKFSQKQDIQNAVSNIAHRGGSTNTWLALKHIRTESFITDHGGRVGIPKIVILVTASGSNGKSKTLNEAKLLHNDPLRVFTVAVGNKVDDDELRAIASKPESILKVKDFNSLSTIRNTLKKKVCKRVCGVVPSDIIFVADASTSIWDADFKKQMDFIISFVKDTVVGRNNTQIGMVSFSTQVINHFYLNAKTSRAAVIAALKGLKQSHGDTYTAKALRFVRTQGFLPSNGGRPDVPHIMIVITDGQSTTPRDTLREATKLAQSNIIAFTIGVGKQIDLNELKVIAGDSSRMFEVANYDTLHTIEKKLFSKVCKIEISQQV